MAGLIGNIPRGDARRAKNTRPEMVRWFAPRELIRTSVEVLSAHAVAWFVDPRAVFGRRDRGRGEAAPQAERRRRSDGAGPQAERRLYRDDASLDRIFAGREELWFDYVSDLGDGFDPTYAIARTLAAKELRLSLPAHEPRARRDDRRWPTQRGQLLVLGGDLTYPTPRANNYEERLIAPYTEATVWEQDDDAPYVLAIPGNHDWYDGLRGFRQMFCRPGSWFAGWRSCQWRSYFAVRLPHDIWLVGADTQLANSINPDQADYFESVKAEIKPDHRIILCLATPDWMEPHTATAGCVVNVMEDLLGHDIEVCLAGHRHHYQRHSIIKKKAAKWASGAGPQAQVAAGAAEPPDADGNAGEGDRSAAAQRSTATARVVDSLQRITAGGGGTYLSPTHVPVHRSLRNHLHRHASFPPPSESRRYRRRLVFLALLEPWFGAIPALIYGLGACLFVGLAPAEFADFLALAKDRAATLPGILFFVVLVLSTLMLRQRFDATSLVIAAVHTAAHLAGILLVSYWVLPSQSVSHFLPVVLAAAVGWGVGATIVGVYLYIASWFDRFVDVGYAALRIDDWKSFLRFHIDAVGNLTIYPIGLRRVPRTWSRRGEGDTALRPEDPRATEPELIEMPICIPARRSHRR